MSTVHGESGFTLVELLVSMLLAFVVFAASLTVLDSSRGVIGRDEARANAAQDPMAGAARMVRELRGTEDVVEMTPNAMDVLVSLGAQLKRVRFDCDVAAPNQGANPYDDTYRRCVRREALATPGADPPALPVLSEGTVLIDRICPGTSATACDSAVSAPAFTCHDSDGSVVACAQLPPPPIDPDDIPEADDEPPPARWPVAIDVSIVVPARGESRELRYGHRIAFNDGVFLRNVNRESDEP